ncbi:MAG: HIT domain-containing protein [Clostridiales bacterium]|jgi:histidine triad (HIT) family protein|nr:HIT domain-containing protein [Clostridiales bacterium]
MNKCIFCSIIKKEINASIVYENSKVLAFNDISPISPKHIIIIPKIHIKSTNEIDQENCHVISEIFEIIPTIAKKNGFYNNGYRIVNNCGNDGGQTVEHLHFHLLGGRSFKWPPG